MSDGILGRCSDSNPCSWPAIRWEMYGTEKKIPTPSSAPPKIIIYVQNLSMGSGGGGAAATSVDSTHKSSWRPEINLRDG